MVYLISARITIFYRYTIYEQYKLEHKDIQQLVYKLFSKMFMSFLSFSKDTNSNSK
jgi:hypothetical protein